MTVTMVSERRGLTGMMPATEHPPSDPQAMSAQAGRPDTGPSATAARCCAVSAGTDGRAYTVAGGWRSQFATHATQAFPGRHCGLGLADVAVLAGGWPGASITIAGLVTRSGPGTSVVRG